MKKILFIISILIGLTSFAQDDDFFWSYSHPKESYDTIKVYRVTSQSVNDYFYANLYTYSGDSVIFKIVDPNGLYSLSQKVKTSTGSVMDSEIVDLCSTLAFSVSWKGYIITKHNDFKGMFIDNARIVETNQAKLMTELRTNLYCELIDSAILQNNKLLSRLNIENSPAIAGADATVDVSNNTLLKYFKRTEPSGAIYGVNELILPSSPELYEVEINRRIQYVTFGELNPMIHYFTANGNLSQSEVDKILKYFVDSNRNPNDMGTNGQDAINLCFPTNAVPSSTGLGYASTLIARGWIVCMTTPPANPPSVSTLDATLVSTTSATLNGSVTGDSGSPVTLRGLCWSTSINPTTANSHIDSGSGIGGFSVNATSLTANTLYHVRAYASNSYGIAYGNDVTFTTTSAIQTVPELTTTAPTAITTTTASSGGTITFDGNYEIIAKGVCWSTSNNPTISGSHTTDGSGTASFTSSITGLSTNTKYYLRAYATNRRDAGGSYVYATGYGQEEEFTTASDVACNLPTVTTNAVNSITTNSAIGGGNATSDGGCNITMKGSCWSTLMNPTTSDPHTTDGSGLGAFSSYISPLYSGTQYVTRAYAINSSGTSYGSNVFFTTAIPSIAQGYGYLYNWYAAMGDINGDGTSETSIANTGWHVATKTEYETLINYVGISTAGNSLKLNGTTLWSASNTGTNLSLFSATGGGYRVPSGEFYDLQNRATIWTSTGYDSTNAWFLGLIVDSPTASLVFSDKNYGHAIRLIRDYTPLVDGQYGWYIGNDGQTYLTFCIGTQEWIISDLKESKFRNGTVIPEVQSGWYYLNYAAKCYYVP